MAWNDMTPEEARKKMLAAMRLDADEGEEETREGGESGGSEKPHYGNTRLPFGLCKRFGIDLPADAKPRDAWAALEKGTGYTHDEIMETVKKVGDTSGISEKKSGSDASVGGGKKATPRCEATTGEDVLNYYKNTLGLTTSFRKGFNPETAKTLANCIADAYDYAPKVKNAISQCGSYSPMREALRKDIYPVWKRVYDRERPNAPEGWRVKEAWRASLVRNTRATAATYLEMPNTSKEFTQEDYDDTERVAKVYRGIYLNNDNDKASTEQLESERRVDEKSGWNPKGCYTVKSLCDHEVGHAIDKAYGLSKNSKIVECIDKYGRSGVALGLSRYAADYKDKESFTEETIAEAWAEYRNNPEPRAIAKELGGIIEGIIKETDGGKK